MWPISTLLGTKVGYFLYSLVLAGVIATTSSGWGFTGVNGGAIKVPDFTTAGAASRTASVPVWEPFIAYVRGTGSTTLRYPGACFANPLKGMSRGSGTLVRLTYHVGNSPAAIGGDIGFVKSCGNNTALDDTASGDTIINNTCTNTGCVSRYTTGTAGWNNADFIKFTPRGNLTSGYTGRITGWVEDIWGE